MDESYDHTLDEEAGAGAARRPAGAGAPAGDEADPAVIAWHVDVTYQVLGTKRRGSATGQAESRSLKKVFTREHQIGAVRYVEAVKDVTFRANRGEAIGIIGHNGSGKSTLLRALAGLVPPTEGRVWLHGQPSLLGVNAVLLNQLSGERNVYIGGQALGLTKAQIRERYDDIVGLADIGEAIDRPMSTYSSGQGARLRFAISTAARPDILMIDEALATGDASFRQKSLAKVHEILEGASTVFLVSHSNSTITEMCDRALWLDHGRLVMDGPATDVVAEYAKGTVPPPINGVPDHRVILPSAEVPRAAEKAAARQDPRDGIVRNIETVPLPPSPAPPQVRAIVWDLEGTLWPGPEEGDERAESYAYRAGIVATLGQSGILNMIVSQDDPDTAAEKLRAQGLWEDFVFPEITYEPAAVVVPRLLREAGLQAGDVAFIDDDPTNLEAVSHVCTGIHCLDSTSDRADDFLGRLAQAVSDQDVNLVPPYRALERRRDARIASGLSDAAFLASGRINVTVIERLHNLPLAPYLERLVNESQLQNYTNSRVADGSLAAFVADVSNNRTFGIVAWDAYGFHGLVGFVSVDQHDSSVQHLVFADRIAGLGIVEAAAAYVREVMTLEARDFPVVSNRPDWVRMVDRTDTEYREQARAHGLDQGERADVRIMGGWSARFVGLATGLSRVDQDQWPSVTGLAELESGDDPGRFAPVNFLWAGRDYDLRSWQGEDPGNARILEGARRLAELTGRHGSQLRVLLPVEDFTSLHPEIGLLPQRFHELNEAWRSVAEGHDHVRTIDLRSLPHVTGEVAEGLSLPDAALHDLGQLLRADVDRYAGGTEDLAAVPVTDTRHLQLLADLRSIGPLTDVPCELPLEVTRHRAMTWEVEVGLSTLDVLRRRAAIALFSVDDVTRVRVGRDRVTKYGEATVGQFYHYLDALSPDSTTRFVVQGREPFTLRKFSLRRWGNLPVGVEVDHVRIWAHRR